MKPIEKSIIIEKYHEQHNKLLEKALEDDIPQYGIDFINSQYQLFLEKLKELD